ncbi:MAG: methyltransferase domain-containing protein [Ruminococcus sp.]|nr:methyltransferase domain-containing protein [Candidatus Copronaster equi]
MIPFEFEERMKKILGEDFDKYEKAIAQKPVRAFRINRNKISEEDFLNINPFGGEKIPFADASYYFDYDGIGNHPYHHAGMIYIQEPAAMSVVAGIDIKHDWNILDLCAAPGGKTTQAAVQNPDGIVVSNEIISSRCKILTGNIERLGFKNVVTTCTDAKNISELFSEEFDLVIVDAPCSGEGMFRKDDTAVTEWSEANVAHCAARQKEILDYINSVVKSNGYLLYSTCTFSIEENEKIIDDFLQNHPEFELVQVNDKIKDVTVDGIKFDGCRTENINFCRRFYPHISKGEGQFVALLYKKCGSGIMIKRNSALEEIPKAEQKIIFDFLDDTLEKYEKKFVKKHKENIVYFDKDFIVPKGIAFSCRVTIGTIQKSYVKPHHQFFSAMGNEFKRKINLTLSEAEKYIKGNTVECDCENGWAAVLIDGCTIGGAKVVNGIAKNHYPKGLRRL